MDSGQTVSEVVHLLPVHNQLGESPIWVSEEQALYWVNWGSNSIFRLDSATGEYQTYHVDMLVTAIARRASGGWVVVAQTGLAFWDPNTNQLDPVVGQPESDRPQIRFNDGVVDRQGRFLVGTFNIEELEAPDSSLYRLDPDGSLHRLDTGFATVNGLGISPDGETLYLTDMRHHLIYAYDYDIASGAVSNRRPFVRVLKEDGLPDGLIVDAEGFVWSAHWGGWRVTRYDPDGRIERVIRFPVEQVTCFGFGGTDMDELYVTTAWYGLGEELRKQQPLAGDLFRAKLDVKGVEESGFSG